MINKSELLAILGPEIKQMIRDYNADVQGDLRVAGDALITGRMSATDLSLDGREVELGWIKDKWVWYYGSATTILIYGEDITEIFPNGTKLRWTQGGGWKYAYVVGTAYASGVNTLTVTGGDDYSVANADIEDNYFSYAACPTGFPGWFNYTPTGSTSGSMTWTSISWTFARFFMVGEMVSVQVYGIGTIGGTASTDLRISCPVSPKSGQTQTGHAIPLGFTPEATACYIGSSTGLITVRRTHSENWPTGYFGVCATVVYRMN